MAGIGNEGSKLNLLLLCFPTQGHLAPMISLARKLLSHGFSITLAVNQSFKDRLLQSYGSSFQIEGYADPFHGPVSDPQVLAFIKSDKKSLRISVSELLHRLFETSNRPCCIVFDPFLDFAPDLALDLGVYSAAFWTASPASLALHDHLLRLIDEGSLPVKTQDDADKEIIWMPGFPPIKISDFPADFQSGERDGPTISSAAQRVSQAKKADWLLFNSFEELDRDIVSYFPKGLAVGPLISTSDQAVQPFWKEDKSCIKWLDSKPPSSVIYVSFGSAAVLSVEQLQELAKGLEESGCSFLLVVRQNLVEKTEEFMSDFCARNKDNGLVISWAPQFEVLNHPSVAGFLTHCGWNSTLESLYSGVPMLGWPFIAEQGMNCFFISDVWKVGFRITRSKDQDLVKKDEVTNLIGKLMKEEQGLQVRQNASRFKIEARKAYSDSGSSCKNLETFVHDLKTKVL